MVNEFPCITLLEGFMNQKFEELLFLFCSCTIAGMKAGSLFTCRKKDFYNLFAVLKQYKKLLQKDNIEIEVLLEREDSVLLYIYRKELLLNIWNQKASEKFLLKQGYSFSVEKNLAILKQKRSDDEFPHDIGIFLGYSIEDIISFIEHKGKNCKYIGPWKVYHKKKEKLRLFEKFKKCNDYYLHSFYSGNNLKQLLCV